MCAGVFAKTFGAKIDESGGSRVGPDGGITVLSVAVGPAELEVVADDEEEDCNTCFIFREVTPVLV